MRVSHEQVSMLLGCCKRQGTCLELTAPVIIQSQSVYILLTIGVREELSIPFFLHLSSRDGQTA